MVGESVANFLANLPINIFIISSASSMIELATHSTGWSLSTTIYAASTCMHTLARGRGGVLRVNWNIFVNTPMSVYHGSCKVSGDVRS